ncbi:MAG: peptide MFS transporter [Alistipes sp.]|nr:peptide MFS transporter [Alistipes sp.]
MFKGHPKGLYALALANTGERFGYYTMLAVFALFLRENFGLAAGTAGAIYSTFLGLVYFMPLVGGILADKFGFGRMVTIGITVMFGGYMLLSFPLGGDTIAMIAMMAALLLISLGTGLFKGNLQVMVGNLYDDPQYADKRDSGFSLFYMAINVGSLFAPTTAVGIKEWAQNSLGFSSNDAYHFAFAVACVALVLSIVIYYVFRSTFRHVEGGKKKGETAQIVDDLTPEQTKQRIVALCLVFAVVIFFWMAFHQNGLTLTYFADEFTKTSAMGIETMVFNVWNLALIIIAVYASFSIFQSTTAKGKILSGAIASAVLAFLVYRAYGITPETTVNVSAPIFQQFNPFYVVALTPVSMAIFGALAKSGKEPSAPRKIAYGMMVAAIGFAIMAIGSRGLNTPNDQARAIAVEKAEVLAENIFNAQGDEEALKVAEKAKSDFEGKLTAVNKEIFDQVFDAQTVILAAKAEEQAILLEEATTEIIVEEASEEAEIVAVEEPTVDPVVAEAEATLAAIKADTKPSTRTSAYWLILTYLILTFAELLLSPMGISFVSKVAPPKLKGLMMGGWFVATAIGNMLVAVGGFLWAGLPLWSVWTVFIVLCLLSALFMFVMMKRLESVTK